MADLVTFVAGGTVQAGGGVYLSREADRELLALCRSGVFAYVLTPRQMGKSSLMVQTSNVLREQGIRTAVVDLTRIGTQLEAEAWYWGLLTTICRQLGLVRQLMEWWREHQHLGVTQRLTQFVEEVLLAEISGRIVIFIDEIDTTLNLDFTDDFFIAIRSFYLSRAEDTRFARLSFVLFGVATPTDLIRNPQRTPFNIGQRVDLTDFTFTEAFPLAVGLGLPEREARQVLQWVLAWTGGHPYLTQRLCQTLREENRDRWSEVAVSELVHRIFFGDASKQDTNLQFVRDMLTRRSPDITAGLTVYREIWRGKVAIADEEQSLVKSNLKLSGVVKRLADGVLLVRNPIYRQVFDLAWVNTNLPVNWAKRARRAAVFMGIAFLGATVPLSVIAAIGWKQAADRQRRAEDLAFVAGLREQSTRVLNYLPTARAAEGLILAMHATIKSRELSPNMDSALISDVRSVVESSMLRASEEVKEQVVFQGQEGKILSAAFSPDNRYIVSSGSDGMIYLWNLRGHKIWEEPIAAHDDAVVSVSFTTNQSIASVGRNGIVKLWQLDGKLIESHEETTSFNVISASFSADNSIIAATLSDGSIAVRNIVNGRWQEWLANKPLIRKVGASLNENNKIIDSSFKYQDSYSFQGQAGQEITAFIESNELSRISLKLTNSEGETIASNSFAENRWVLRGVLREAGNYKIVVASSDEKGGSYNLAVNPLLIKSISVSPDNQQLATASPDGGIQLWSLQGNLINTSSQKHQGEVLTVAFSSDGKHIVSGGKDRAVRLWNLEGDAISEPFRDHNDEVLSVAFSSDGQQIVSGGQDGTLRLSNLAGNAISEPLRGHNDTVLLGSFDREDRHILSIGTDDTLRLWDANINIPFQGHKGNIQVIDISPDGRLIVSSGDDGTVRLWDLNKKTMVRILHEQENPVYSVAFSPDGKTIASSGDDGTVYLWDMNGNTLTKLSQGNKNSVYSLTFSPNSTMMAGSYNDGSIGLWNLNNVLAEQFRSIQIDERASFYTSGEVVFDSNGRHILKGGRLLALLDIEGNVIWKNSEAHREVERYLGTVWAIAFSPNGQLIVSGGPDRTIRLWDLQGNPIGQPFRGHEGAVKSLAFSPDGQRIVSGSKDRTIRLWDLQGNPIGSPFQGHSDDVQSIVFSPDGRRIISGSFDGTLRLWWASWKEWLQNSCNRLQHHPILRKPDKSLGEEFLEIAAEVSNACDNRVWEQYK
ncbi:MAG: AAA-like domain-containing protein [Spirulina sp.]